MLLHPAILFLHKVHVLTYRASFFFEKFFAPLVKKTLRAIAKHATSRHPFASKARQEYVGFVAAVEGCRFISGKHDFYPFFPPPPPPPRLVWRHSRAGGKEKNTACCGKMRCDATKTYSGSCLKNEASPTTGMFNFFAIYTASGNSPHCAQKSCREPAIT